MSYNIFMNFLEEHFLLFLRLLTSINGNIIA